MKSETLMDVINYIDCEIDRVKDRRSDYCYEDFITIIHSIKIIKLKIY